MRSKSDSVQALLEAISAGDDIQAEKAALALGEGGEEAFLALQRLATAKDTDRRWWACRALAAVGTQTAIDALIGMLDDADADVRACAVVALSQLRPERAIGPLAARLSDPSAYVGRLTADALSQFGEAAVETLIGALREGDTAARAGAARALSAIQPEKAVPALCKALEDSSAVVSYYAKDALEKMGVGILLFRP